MHGWSVCIQVWNILDVLNVLQALVDKSGIVAELEADGGADIKHHEGYLPNQSNVLRMLGYFSLIGQLRVSVDMSAPQPTRTHRHPVAMAGYLENTSSCGAFSACFCIASLCACCAHTANPL